MSKNLLKRLLSFAVLTIFLSAFVPCGAFADILSAQATADAVVGGITLSGNAGESGKQIAVTITSPKNEICYITQLASAKDGKFAMSYVIKERINGTYKIELNSFGFSAPRQIYCDVNFFKDVEISDINYTTASSNQIREIYPHGELIANSNVANNTNSKQKFSLYKARYNQNADKMSSAIKIEKEVAPGECASFETVYDNTEKATDIVLKTFLWNDNLSPNIGAAPVSYYDMFTDAGQWYREFARGILRPDEGTAEFTVCLNKPIDEFGTGYDFLFSVLPSKELKTGGTNLFAVTFPTAPQDSLLAVIRDSDGVARYGGIKYSDLKYNLGEKFNLAVSWKVGGSIKMYINGELVSTSPLSDGFSDDNLPYSFRVCCGEPFNTSQMKISTRELTQEELEKKPNDKFSLSEDTCTLSFDNMQKRIYQTTPWQSENAYNAFVPINLTENQCYTLGEKIYCRYAGVNYGSDTAQHRISVEIRNSDGEIADSIDRNVSVSADGKYHIYSLDLNNIHSADLYSVKTIVDGMEYESKISVLPSVDNSVPDGSLADFYGQDLEYYMDSGYVEKLNSKFIRNQAAFAWYTIEPQKGQFTWSKTDEFVNRLKKSGTQCLGVLGKWPRWAAQEPTDAEKENMQKFYETFTSWKPKDVDDWREYVYQTVSRYKDSVKYWEIINEVNFKPPYSAAAFTGTNEEYVELLKAAYEAAKDADPDCIILTSGFTSNSSADPSLPLLLTDSEYSNGYYDVYNVHGYNGAKVWQEVINKLKENNPSAKFIMSEYMPMSVSDEGEKAMDNILSEISFMNLGADKYLNMGTWSDNFLDIYSNSPTLAYQATGVFQNSIRKCNEKLTSYSFENDNIFCIKDCFVRTDGKFLSVFASTVGENIVLELNGKVRAAYDIYGRKIKFSDGGTNAKVEFNNLVYIVSDEPVEIKGVCCDYRNKFANSGFEVTHFGEADGWTKRENEGSIELCADSFEGESAIAISNPSADKTSYIFRDLKVDSEGTYTFGAMVKNNGNSPAKVMLRIYDRDRNSTVTEQFTVSSNEYMQIKKDFKISQSDSEPHAFIVGIIGAGEIVVDNAKLVC